MPRRTMDFSHRVQPQDLPELMDEACSREDLRGALRELARLNRWFLGYRPTLDWLEGLSLERSSEPVRILDVGCGCGDMLRQIERWAHRQGIAVVLTGLDANPDCTAIASEATGAASRIRWVAGSVFDYFPRAKPHLIISSLFAHHLSDPDVVRFVGWMEQNCMMGWFVNDLSRAPVPYHLFGLFARAARLHPFVRHDGPVSFARAFQPFDWRRLCAAAGLAESEYGIVSYKPARLCVSRRK